MNYRERYEELTDIIKHHMDLYYNDDSPEISDNEYDGLMLELKAIEKEHPEITKKDSPSKIIGGKTRRTAGINVTHDVPMLSIEDVFTKDDVLSWVHEVRSMHQDVRFDVEQKIDGLSMSIRYDNGILRLAETRGDGMTGEDVTPNARVIPDVVQKLTKLYGYLEVRGEVYMSHEDFERTNELQEANGKKTFANPRNCAAGTLRQLDSAMVSERGLSMFIFNVQKADENLMKSHHDALMILKNEENMKIVPSKLCTTDEEIISEIDRIGEERGSLDYDIDGAVIKIDQIAYRSDFPAGTKYSAGHIAYKYPPEEKESVVRDIEISVGMTGRLNPTAIFDPIRLCGTTVSRATLHNQDFIDSLEIGIGDTVVVYKSGEIIPKIKSVNLLKRPSDCTVFKIPDRCPVCGSKVVREEDTADMKCTNQDCPAKLVRRIINFVGRDAMDIKGFGDEYIRELIEQGYIKSIFDIYRLKEHRNELVEKGIIGKEKNTDKLLDMIEKSKQNDPYRLLAGLAIANVGKASAKTVMRHFGSFDELMGASKEELTGVQDVGEITAAAIFDFFHVQKNIEMINALRAEGVKLENEAPAYEQDGILAGKTFVITGELMHYKNRDELTAVIEAHGGKVSGSVSSKTFALINNDASSNSGKNKKANELGINIMTEDSFIKMAGI